MDNAKNNNAPIGAPPVNIEQLTQQFNNLCREGLSQTHPPEDVNTNTRHPNTPLPGLIHGPNAIYGVPFAQVKHRLTLYQNDAFKPQTGGEAVNGIYNKVDAIVGLFKNMSTLYGVDLNDKLIREFEGLAMLAFSVTRCTDAISVCSTVLLYLRSFTTTSMYSVIAPYVTEIFAFTTQDGEELEAVMEGKEIETETLTSHGLVSTIQNVLTDWRLVTTSPFFTHISKLLGLIVLAGLCEASDLKVSIGDIKLCEPHLFDSHASAIDICDAALSGVTFFVERFHAAWTRKDPSLLIIDEKSKDLDTRYAHLMGQWDLVRTGNLEKIDGVTTQEFDRELETFTRNLKVLLPSVRGFEKKLVADKYERLLEVRNNFTTMQIASGLRRAPFVIETFGESDQGKTSLVDQLITALLASQNLPTEDSYRASYNSGDEFLSGWSTDKLVLLMDDCWNEKPSVSGKTGVLKIILDACNNQMVYANMAELAKKDKTFLQPEIVVMYTNDKAMLAGETCVCPYAIQRRPHVVITVEGRPEFRKYRDGKPQGLNPEAIVAWSEQNEDPVFDDIWLLTVEKAVQPEHLHQVADYTTLSYKGEKLEKVPFVTVVQYLIEEFDKHRKIQQQIIDRKAQRAAQVEKCDVDGCIQIKGYCRYHPEVKSYKPLPVPPPDPKEVYKREMTKLITSATEDCNPGRCTRCGGLHAPRGSEGLNDMQSAMNQIALEHEIPRMSYTYVFPNRHSSQNHRRPIGAFGRGGRDGRRGGRGTPVRRCEAGSEKPYGYRIYSAITRTCDFVVGKVTDDIHGFGDKVETAVTAALYGSALAFAKRWDWLWFIPSSVVEDKRFTQLIMYFDRDRIVRRYSLFTMMNAFWSTALPLMAKWKMRKLPNTHIGGILAVTGITALCIQKKLVTIVEDDYVAKLKERNTLSTTFQRFRDEHAGRVCTSVLAIGALYTLAKVYRQWKGVTAQGSLEPKTPEEIAERDAESNSWAAVTVRKLPISVESKTTTPSKFQDAILKNLTYASIKGAKANTQMANVLFIDSNRAIIPHHYFTLCGEDIDITFRKKNPDSVGGKFCDRVSLDKCYHIPGTDLVVAHIDTGGSYKNLSRWLPRDKLPLFSFTMYYRNREGTVVSNRGTAKGCTTRTHACSFEGGVYTSLERNTFPGLCGAPVISESSGTTIAGFHLGGFENSKQGCFGVLTQEQYQMACDALDAKHLIKTGSAEVFDMQSMGVNILDPTEPAPNSPLHFLPKDSQVMYLGKCPGEIHHSKSDYKRTLISKSVSRYCGVANKWGPPKFHPEWYGWQKCLANLSIPAHSFPYALLERAREDYIAPLRELFQSELWNDACPLTDHQTINGIPGKRFIDAMKFDTSIGFPLKGPKSEYVVGEPGNRKFNQVVQAEIDRCLEHYRKGERAFPIAKACKKDEILSDSSKCRIFYCNAVSTVFILRKYFLPIARVFQMNPLLSECAVGINSHSPEWDELRTHVLKYDNIIGGDYSKYDQRLPAQLILCAFSIYIELAGLAKYSKDDITIMKALAGDIVYALIAFNGSLIGLTEGTHISGNSMTVIVNGTCGSLNLRCAYFDLVQNARNFREDASITTYGDDNYGSVNERVKKVYNITSISSFLAKYGQTYTMPDKNSDISDFLPDEGTFLSRYSVLNPDLGCYVGALEDESIFKALHGYLRPKKHPLTEAHACAQNLDTALLEVFFQGKESFERRREQFRKVAEECDIVHLCTRLDETYEDRVKSWRAKYLGETGPS